MTIRLFNLNEFLLRLITSLLARALFNEIKSHFNQKPDLERYGDACGAASLLLLSTNMFLFAILTGIMAYSHGFSVSKLVLACIFIFAGISAFKEHKKILNKHRPYKGT